MVKRILTILVLVGLLWAPVAPQARTSMIVQAADIATAAALVHAVGGEVTHELEIINAVSARLTAAQLARLERAPAVKQIYADTPVQVASLSYTTGQDPLQQLLDKVKQVGADQVHAQGITGRGVGVAFLDSGYYIIDELNRNAYGQNRIVAQYNAITNVEGLWVQDDQAGHGAHIMTTAASSYSTAPDGTLRAPAGTLTNNYHGIAPGINLISVKAFGSNGGGSYADVIRGIDWVVSHKNAYNIRVLNCSFSAPPQSYYWDDPLNQAIMRAWQAGIVVVAAAGNTGPNPMTIGVPGNVPYIITVGAVSDNGTPTDGRDDFLSSFSATGPTVEGFVKPELVAPGGHIMASMSHQSQIALAHPEFFNGTYGNFFQMSGTSQSTAVVSGIVALMLERNPNLTPNDVKCRLVTSARTAMKADGSPAYSVFQQGAGMVNAYAAVYSTASGCANQNLNIAADLAGTVHYGGRANRNPDTGAYYLMGLEGYVWGGGYATNESYVWGGTYVWGDGYVWGNGYVWGDAYVWGSGYVWGDGYVWSGTYVWGDSYVWGGTYVWGSAVMALNTWVYDDPYRTSTSTPGVPTMYVSNLAGSSVRTGWYWLPKVTVTVRDNNGVPVANAKVTGKFDTNSYVCLTDGSGQCTVNRGALSWYVPSTTFTVSEVTHAQYTYNASANSMTSIQVVRP